ncbi:hypothetical protein [Neoroseomonas rubea]|uniref:hypothetical protein n=1 Tax=Neoroseomonas rubea TaxID=2748666 RepID=UPI0018DFE63B|nr:hypothetical protein [Roseomonas rubea]
MPEALTDKMEGVAVTGDAGHAHIAVPTGMTDPVRYAQAAVERALAEAHEAGDAFAVRLLGAVVGVLAIVPRADATH